MGTSAFPGLGSRLPTGTSALPVVRLRNCEKMYPGVDAPLILIKVKDLHEQFTTPTHMLIKLWANSLLVLLAICLLTGCSSVRNNAKTFNTVVIDPGHGAHDSGAVSRRGTREKTVNLDVAQRLEPKLRAAGFKTVMTRNNDTFIPLGTRTAISNRYSDAIFVSIHFNSARNRGARGIETFYEHPYSRSLASSIQNCMIRELRATNRGVKHAEFYVLRKNLNPAILLECGFLSNSADDNLARNPAYRERIAQSIANGIILQRYGAHSPRLPQPVPDDLFIRSIQ